MECQETILYFESEEVLEEIVSCFGEEDIKKYLGLHMLAAIPTEKRESI